MPSPEFETILASLQKIVNEAYSLGRSEALKQVVEVLKADSASARPLALMAPSEQATAQGLAARQDNDENAVRTAPAATGREEAEHATAANATAQQAAAEQVVQGPWWARPPRRA